MSRCHKKGRKAALRLAEAIALDPGLADESVWAALCASFTEPAIMEVMTDLERYAQRRDHDKVKDQP